MDFKFVFLWTDLALWALFCALGGYAWHASRQPPLRATWGRARTTVPRSCGRGAGAVHARQRARSVHFRQRPAQRPGQAAGVTFYNTRTGVAARFAGSSTADAQSVFGAAGHARAKENWRDGAIVRDVPRLKFGGAHLAAPERDWAGDVFDRIAAGLAGGALLTLAVSLALAAWVGREHGTLASRWRAIVGGRTRYPWRVPLLTLAAIALADGPVVALMGDYHVLGTDRTGNDVLVQALKSVRTAFVIGTLSTLATVPLALGLGVLAGYFKGWVDEAVQYLYTVLTSVPNVLLIAAGRWGVGVVSPTPRCSTPA
jgi:peptide/nickel transport system permease protein